MQTIKVGDKVRATTNKHMTYRVLSIGKKRARLKAEDTPCWFSCYCPVELLIKL